MRSPTLPRIGRPTKNVRSPLVFLLFGAAWGQVVRKLPATAGGAEFQALPRIQKIAFLNALVWAAIYPQSEQMKPLLFDCYRRFPSVTVLVLSYFLRRAEQLKRRGLEHVLAAIGCIPETQKLSTQARALRFEARRAEEMMFAGVMPIVRKPVNRKQTKARQDRG